MIADMYASVQAAISSLEAQAEAQANKLQAVTSELWAMADSNTSLQSQLEEGACAVSQLQQSAREREHAHAEAVKAHQEGVQMLQKQVEVFTR